MRLSVVITTYCRPEGLDATLQSVALQTRTPDEIIVSDNASPDSTPQVVLRWQDKLPQLRYLRNETNIGMPGNLNNAVYAATGDVICNLHDADTYAPNLLQRIEETMNAHAGVGLVFWDSECIHAVDRGIAPLTDGREFFQKHYQGQTSSKIWGTVAVRKEVYDKLLPFDERFRAWADVDMWMRICLDSEIAYLHEPLAKLHVGGEFRPWNWEKTILQQKMHFLNVVRHHENDPEQCHKVLKQQLAAQRGRYVRHMIGRLRRRELSMVWSGMKLFKRYFTYPDDLPELNSFLRDNPL